MAIKKLENPTRYYVRVYVGEGRKVRRIVQTKKQALALERELKEGKLSLRPGGPPMMPIKLLVPYFRSWREGWTCDWEDAPDGVSRHLVSRLTQGKGEIQVRTADSFLAKIGRTEVWHTDPELAKYYHLLR